jgi:hypothetical protein
MRRAQATVILGICGVVLVGFLLMADFDNDPVSVYSFRKIEIGMTFTDVRAILGEPTAIGGTGAFLFPDAPSLAEWNRPGNILIVVRFDASGHATEKICEEADTGILRRIRRFIGI